MPWLRLDEGFSEHRKVLELSDAAFRLHVTALCFCARNLTDGFVSEVAAHRCHPKPKALIAELISAHLWTRTSGGYAIHDYLGYNPTRAQVESERQKAKERRTTFGLRSPERKMPRTPYPVSIDKGTPERGGLRHISEALRGGDAG